VFIVATFGPVLARFTGGPLPRSTPAA
jgi:hypothetical protein